MFKCSTLCSFDDKNALGNLDPDTKLINWDKDKITNWFSDVLPDKCVKCKWLGACLGPCNRQIIAHGNEEICTFDAMNLDDKEYLLYLFKYNILYSQLFSNSESSTEPSKSE